MTILELYADSLEVVHNHYKFSKPPLEARIVLLEEMITNLCIAIDVLRERDTDDGK